MKAATHGWLESAKMDLDSIEFIKDQDYLTPVIAIHAQQAVEKSFKALLEEKELDVFKTHDIIFLFKKTLSIIQLETDIKILQKLNELYIDARYPGEMGLPEGKPSLRDAQGFYKLAKNIYDQVMHTLSTSNSGFIQSSDR